MGMNHNQFLTSIRSLMSPRNVQLERARVYPPMATPNMPYICWYALSEISRVLLLEVSDGLGTPIFGFSDKNCVYDHKLGSIGPGTKKNHLGTAHSYTWEILVLLQIAS